MAVTIKDVAREAGVSVASVSRALNDHGGVTPATQQHVREIATRLRYVPHGAARSLITKQTQTIGALLPDLHGEFFSELIRGIDLAARAHGLHLLVSSSHGNAEEAAIALRAMQGRVDGLLILSPHVDGAFLQAHLPHAMSAVLLNNAETHSTHSVINVDNGAGARAMVRHLFEIGHEEVAFISGPADNFDAQQREKGYLEAIAEHASMREPLIFRGDFSEASGHRVGQQLLKMSHPPRAIFAANDMMAVGCQFALQQGGLSIPDDIALAGFDDIPITRYVTPTLSTVRVRIAELGRRALEQLVATLRNGGAAAMPSTQTLACEIVVRQSCGTKP